MAETHAAYHYDLHTHDAGMGQFQRGSRIAIGHPTHVHVNDLHHVAPGPDPHNPHASFMPSNLHPQDTHELRHAVRKSCVSFNRWPAITCHATYRRDIWPFVQQPPTPRSSSTMESGVQPAPVDICAMEICWKYSRVDQIKSFH